MSTLAAVLCVIGLSTQFTITSTSIWRFDYGSHMIPHPEKETKGGEDAFYAEDGVLSVADGVGGWVEVGVDPAKYSRKLCNK